LEQWLSDLTRRGARATPAEIINIITQIGSALDAAHQAGIIHRDVKPANAIWNASGALGLTDFGVAKPLFNATNQTQVGMVLGTPSYLSPEQAQGLPLTPASDLYSLGVMMYELIAGDVPFHDFTPVQAVIAHIHQPPPLLRARYP